MNMDAESEVILSPHTNKPAGDEVEKPIFWCGVCLLKMLSPSGAIQHLIGRSHKAKLLQKDANSETNKRKLPGIDSPGKKKLKEGEGVDLFCSDCNVGFTSVQDSNQHHGGKKHAAKIAAKSRTLSQRGRSQSRGHGSGKYTGKSNRYAQYTAGSSTAENASSKGTLKKSIPGARKSLSDYFVNPAKERFYLPEETITTTTTVKSSNGTPNSQNSCQKSSYGDDRHSETKNEHTIGKTDYQNKHSSSNSVSAQDSRKNTYGVLPCHGRSATSLDMYNPKETYDSNAYTSSTKSGYLSNNNPVSVTPPWLKNSVSNTNATGYGHTSYSKNDGSFSSHVEGKKSMSSESHYSSTDSASKAVSNDNYKSYDGSASSYSNPGNYSNTEYGPSDAGTYNQFFAKTEYNMYESY